MALICLLAGSASKFGELSIKADELEAPVAPLDGRRERRRWKERKRGTGRVKMSLVKTKQGIEVFQTNQFI